MAKLINVKKETVTRCNGGIFEGAPDWYDTPLDKLEFEWSPDEELEIERYCEKILKDINESEEEVTPKERFEATMAGKPKDRQLVQLAPANTYLARVLSAGGDSVRPVDIIRNPKMFVKGHLAYLARVPQDWPMYSITAYSGLGLWGGRAKMIEYGQPILVEPGVKSMADLENFEVPDPRKDGLYPGYLWSCREMKRIFDEYGLSKVMAIWSAMCAGPAETVMESMMGWTPFVKALRNDPDVCKRGADLALEWCTRLGAALIELSRPEIIQCCQASGVFPITGNEWVADRWADLAKALKALSPQTQLTNGLTSLSTFDVFTDVLIERGAAGPDAWNGGITGPEAGMEKLVDYYKKNNMFFTTMIPYHILEDGPISAIEEECKKLCEYSKSNLKFSPGATPAGAHWTPLHHVDAAAAALKKYGKY